MRIMIIYIFLDTNVFIHCKLFTEIEWRALLKKPDKSEKIFIVVPYMVNEELDYLKKSEKKARKVQKKLRELKDVEFKDGITLSITLFPIKWSSLKPDWAEKLNENIHDCQIIAEVLLFKDNHPEDEIIFITGDNTPYFQADALGIKAIFWRDDEFKLIFKPSKVEAKIIKRLTKLKMQFKNEDVNYAISIKKELSLDEFVAMEFPDYIDLMKDDEKGSTFSKESSSSEKVRNKEIEEKNVINGDLTEGFKSSLINLFSNYVKSHEVYKEEILKYYKEMMEYSKYIEIELFLTNIGIRPFNNVNIEVYTVLEKGFELKSKNELEKPEKPEKETDPLLFSPLPITSSYPKEYNVKYFSTEKREKEKNDVWSFGYNIMKIQHKTTLSLYPIMIKFPDGFKANKIHFICKFRHDEEGETNDQKIILTILK